MLLWRTVAPVKLLNWISNGAKHWDRPKKGRLSREETEREDRAGGGGGRQEKPKTGSLNEFIEKRPGIGTDTPHHTTVETLTSPLSVFLSAITLSLPPSPPSLHLLRRCTWPLHFLSLHFLPFTPFLSPLSSFLFLLTLPDLTLVLFLSLLFCRWIVLFLLCVFLNLSLLPWQRLRLCYWSLLHLRFLPLLPFDFSFNGFKDNAGICFVQSIISISHPSKYYFFLSFIQQFFCFHPPPFPPIQGARCHSVLA